MPHTELWRIIRNDHVGSWIKILFATKSSADMAERQRLEDDPTIKTIRRLREPSNVVELEQALEGSQ